MPQLVWGGKVIQVAVVHADDCIGSILIWQKISLTPPQPCYGHNNNHDIGINNKKRVDIDSPNISLTNETTVMIKLIHL